MPLYEHLSFEIILSAYFFTCLLCPFSLKGKLLTAAPLSARPPPSPRCLPRCPKRIPTRSWQGAGPLYTHPGADGDTEAGAERREQGLQEPSGLVQGASPPPLSRGPDRAQCGPPRRFGSRAFAFQGPGRGHAGQSGPRPEAAAPRPLGPQWANKGICMKTGTPFAGRTRCGVHRMLQRPTAVRPSWDGEGGGVGGRGHRAETAVWVRAAADSSHYLRRRGHRARDPGPSHGAAAAAGLRSQPSPPQPRTSIPAPV